MALRLILLAALAAQAPAAQISASPAGGNLQPGTPPPLVAPDPMSGEINLRFFPPAERRVVAYEAATGALLFPVVVGGRESWAIVDSGADGSIVDIALAREAGVTLTDVGSSVQTSGALLKSHAADGVSLVIPGQIEARMPRLHAIDLGIVGGRKLGFVVGADLLHGLAIAVNTQARTFQFGPSGSVSASSRARSLDLTSTRPPMATVSVGEAALSLYVDTGTSAALRLTPEAWARVTPSEPQLGTTLNAGGDGAPRLTRTMVLPHTSIAGYDVGPVTALESDSPTNRGDGFLGLGYLSNFRWAMDLGAGKLWLQPLPPGAP